MSVQRTSYRKHGFTLIELLVVLAILALLLTIATPRYFDGIDRAKEHTLKQDLIKLRETIDQFYADRGVYPNTLDELVEKKYLRQTPVDPITGSTTTWILVAPEPPLTGGIYDIHSGAEGVAADGTRYQEW